MINYISTRGQAPRLSFEEVVMAGLASDGGLYVPDSVPTFSEQELMEMSDLPYTELAFRVMKPFIGNAIPEKDLRKMIEETYSEKNFRSPAIAPLKKLGNNEYLLELFHGPTLAFKDFALQFLGRVFEYFLTPKHQEITIIGATSGDTGSAAIEGCRGRKGMRIFILYPNSNISKRQRKQMTTVTDDNVYAIPVYGSFDNCQDIVKSLFANQRLRKKCNLTAVNSINWARILAQIVYYFYAFFQLKKNFAPEAERVSFSVPTGNFGDIYAGYIAKKMGLPVDRLIIATNKNDILARCLENGTYEIDKHVYATNSPSMDIQVSSNFERLLFDLYDHDGEEIKRLMEKFKTSGEIRLSEAAFKRLREAFDADRADQELTLATIASVYKATNKKELIDPHTAVGVAVGRKVHEDKSIPLIYLATAHSAKFPEAVEEATGEKPKLPPHLIDLDSRPEVHPRFTFRQDELRTDTTGHRKKFNLTRFEAFIENPS